MLISFRYSNQRSTKAISRAYTHTHKVFTTHMFQWHIYSFKTLSKGQWTKDTLPSAAFVYDLGIMYDAASELCDLSKQLKERHDIARSLFWGVRADSGLCING
jgi:hypothetical protein